MRGVVAIMYGWSMALYLNARAIPQSWKLAPLLLTIAAFIISPEAFPICLAEWRDGFAETFAGYTQRGYLSPTSRTPL
jgi:hypothetical protein